ncbi:MAG: hypothetical protein ACLFMM_02210 [Methanohalobium sp.]|uniref:hypothetical protein n=1 Tax=Methanohalobium sp. TaxID=2837493 RepID=UPI00397AD32B
MIVPLYGTCTICGDVQDSKQYESYNICTACADILEDIMTDYFINTFNNNKSKDFDGFVSHLYLTGKPTSDYNNILEDSSSYTRRKSNRTITAMEYSEHSSKKRYFENMNVVLEWLKDNPEFYLYYLRNYYECPNCSSSLFNKFRTCEVGNWFVVSCSNCETLLKKYYSPKTG